MAGPNAGLSREFVERQRQRLEAIRAQLQGSEQRARAAVRVSQEELEEGPKDLVDIAQTREGEEVRQERSELDTARLGRIDRALRKIADGTYGLSDASGDPIAKERLEAVPEAVLTLEEEEEREASSVG